MTKTERNERHRPTNFPRIQVGMYSYGAPRVGNHIFARDYNIFVPNSFRVGLFFPYFSHMPLIALPLPSFPRAVVDGDIVSGVPSAGYKHIGTNVIVDSKGEGSIIIDPSFVEKYLRMSSKTSIGAHSLNVYRRGLKGVKLATLYLNGKLDDTQKRNIFHLEEEEEKPETDGISLPARRSKRSSTSLTTRANSTASLDASVMKIAQESCAYVASCLNDEDDKDDKEACRKGEEDDPELKLRNQDITNVDQWAVEMQNLTVFEKFLLWVGFGEANGEEAPCVDIVPDSSKQILEIASNTLHQDLKTESGEKE